MSKYKNPVDFFTKNVPHLKPSQKLIRDLREFRLKWATKGDDYIDFLGSKLLGPHAIRFSSLDDDNLMIETLNIEHYDKLQEDIYSVKDIEKKYKIGSNIIYQTLAYISHMFFKDKTLKKELKEEGIREACLIMQYRMFASLYSWYFKFNTTEAVATTVFNKLSNKFLIKQLGSWQEVFEYRVNNCLDKSSPNYKKLKTYTSEDSIRLISDIQTKLREQVKQIFKVLINVLENKEVLQQDNETFVGGEKNEEQIKDIENNYSKYINNILSIALSRNNFIETETLDVVDNLFPNIDRKSIYKFLVYMSDDDNVDRNHIEDTIENILTINFMYLQRYGINIEQREYIPKAIIMIKNYWSSSKVNNPIMDEIKEYLQKEAFNATGKKTGWVLVTLAISYIVYVFLRSIK